MKRAPALVASVLIGLSAAVGGAAAEASGAPGSPTPSPSTSYSRTSSPFSLTISPTRLVVQPVAIGRAHHILVVNRGHSTVPVTVQKRDFTGNRDGSLLFRPQAPYAASTWIDVKPARFDLPAGSSLTVDATITMPTSPEPGDHEVALVFLVPAGRTGANIKINRGVATPVYITVPGPSSNAASLTELRGRGFTSGDPVSLTATVHDNGTVHRDFRGKHALPVHGSGSGRFPDFTVLRGGTRDVTINWRPPLMCICHPKVTIANADGTSSSKSVTVVVFPVVEAAVALGLLLLLVVVVLVGRRRYRADVAHAAAALNSSADNNDE